MMHAEIIGYRERRRNCRRERFNSGRIYMLLRPIKFCEPHLAVVETYRFAQILPYRIADMMASKYSSIGRKLRAGLPTKNAATTTLFR